MLHIHHLTFVRISGICTTYPTVEQTGERVVRAGDLQHDMLKMITAWTVFKTKDQLIFIMAYSST